MSIRGKLCRIEYSLFFHKITVGSTTEFSSIISLIKQECNSLRVHGTIGRCAAYEATFGMGFAKWNVLPHRTVTQVHFARCDTFCETEPTSIP